MLCLVRDLPAQGECELIGCVQSVGKLLGGERRRCTLTLADDTGTVRLTLFGSFADLGGSAVPGDVLLCRCVRASVYRGAVTLASTFGSSFETNPPDVPHTSFMRLDRTLRDLGGRKSATVLARVTDVNPGKRCWYDACAACGSKVHQQSTDDWYCQSCNAYSDAAQRRLMLQVRLTDCSGSVTATLWHEQAEKLLDTEGLVDAYEEDQPEYLRILRGVRDAGDVFRMVVTTVERTYNGKTSAQHTVTHLRRLTASEHSEALLRAIGDKIV